MSIKFIIFTYFIRIEQLKKELSQADRKIRKLAIERYTLKERIKKLEDDKTKLLTSPTRIIKGG